MYALLLAIELFSLVAFGDNTEGFPKGIYKRPTKNFAARGKFLVAEIGKGKGGFKLKEQSNTIYTSSRLYFIPHAAPCDAKTEFTMMEGGFPDTYWCVDSKVLKENLKQYTPDYYDILGYVEAKTSIPAEKEAAKTKLLERDGNLSWWARAKLPPPAGIYFYPHFPFDIRGPFEGIYKDGELKGYRKVNAGEKSELEPYKNYFVSDSTEPCDSKTEYSIRKTGDKIYYCILKNTFDRAFSIALNYYAGDRGEKVVLQHVIEGDDVVYASKESKEYVKKAKVRHLRRVSADFPGRGKEVLDKVDPFEKMVLADKPTATISIYTFKDQTVDGYLITYHGLLYGLCGNQCRLQGYTILMDKTGKVVKFLDSTLAQTAQEYDIPTAGLLRIQDIANNKNDSLKTLFEKTPKLDSDYVARMSSASELWGAGNSVGTFQLHVSLVREKLGFTKDWPIFHWK